MIRVAPCPIFYARHVNRDRRPARRCRALLSRNDRQRFVPVVEEPFSRLNIYDVSSTFGATTGHPCVCLLVTRASLMAPRAHVLRLGQMCGLPSLHILRAIPDRTANSDPRRTAQLRAPTFQRPATHAPALSQLTLCKVRGLVRHSAPPRLLRGAGTPETSADHPRSGPRPR